LKKLPLTIKFSISFFIISFVLSVINLYLNGQMIWTNSIEYKIGIFITYFIFLLTIYLLYKGKNFIRVSYLIILLLNTGYLLIIKLNVKEGVLLSFIDNNLNLYNQITQIILIIATILLLFPSSHQFFLKHKNFTEQIAWHPTRVFAFIIDLAILWLLFSLITYLFFDYFVPLNIFTTKLIAFIIFILYFSIFDTLFQTTPGKKLLFIKIGDKNLNKKSLKNNLLRIFILLNFVFFTNLFENNIVLMIIKTLTIGIFVTNIWLSLITPNNKTLYDYITETYTFYEIFKTPLQDDPINKRIYKNFFIILLLISIPTYFAYRYKNPMLSDTVKEIKQEKYVQNVFIEFKTIPDNKGYVKNFVFVELKINKKITKNSKEFQIILIKVAKALFKNYLNPGEYLILSIKYGVNFEIFEYYVKIFEQRSLEAIKDQIFLLEKLKNK